MSLGLFPGLPTRLILPLSVLDGQTVFLLRTPGRLKAVATGRRLAPADTPGELQWVPEAELSRYT